MTPLTEGYAWCDTADCLHIAYTRFSTLCPIHIAYPWRDHTNPTVPTGTGTGSFNRGVS